MSPLEGVATDRLRAEARGRRPLSRRNLYETYMIMLACRGKKLTDEEREYTKVGSRGEMMREELIWIQKRNVELPKFSKKPILHFIAQEKSFLGLGTLQYDFGSREIWRNKSAVCLEITKYFRNLFS